MNSSIKDVLFFVKENTLIASISHMASQYNIKALRDFNSTMYHVKLQPPRPLVIEDRFDYIFSILWDELFKLNTHQNARWMFTYDHTYGYPLHIQLSRRGGSLFPNMIQKYDDTKPYGLSYFDYAFSLTMLPPDTIFDDILYKKVLKKRKSESLLAPVFDKENIVDDAGGDDISGYVVEGYSFTTEKDFFKLRDSYQ